MTFLFTDVEDSSRLWDQFPLQMRIALEQHDALLAAAIEANGGYVFTTAGDSFSAAFSTADEAASAAVEIQRTVSAAKWDPSTPVRVRVGLHTGEAHERGGDYFGPAVNRAARIESAGHGGQVLVSEVTARVLAQSTTAVWELVELGEHRLKGLSEPERISQLGAGHFAALHTARTATTNVRGDAPDLLGRADDCAAIIGLLAASSLVTVTGAGGVGKTSVATVVAHEALRTFEEVWVVELAGLAEADSILGVILGALGAAGPADPEELELALAVRGEVLLVLDNCEHVGDAVADVADALARTPNVTVLATSRVELMVPHEYVYRLGPLGETEAATELFLRAARRRGSATEDFAGEMEAIERICEGVDCIPLAIELAAARTRSLDPNQILSQLEVIMSSAGRGSRRDARHATMAATVDWSIELLDPEMRKALACVAAFAGTFDLEGAEAVLGWSALGAADLIDELVGHSLLEPARTEQGLRYRLLEPVRHQARLLDPGTLTSAQDAHLEHFVGRVEAAYDSLATAGCRPILALLRHDFDNLRAAHRRALESHRIADDLRLYRPLAFTTWHAIYEIAEWASQTLEAAEDTSGEEFAPAQMLALVATMMTLPTWTSAENSPAVRRLVNDLEGHLERGSDNDWAVVGLAWKASIGDSGRWADTTEGFAPDDIYLQFMNDHFGASARWYRGQQGIEELRAELARSIERYRGFGADNLAAALAVLLGQFEILEGDPQRGHDLVLEAEAAANDLGMGWLEKSAVLNQASAARAGVSTIRHPAESLLEVLVGSLTNTGAAMAQQALGIAADLLAEAGHDDLATRAIEAARDAQRDGRAASDVAEEVVQALRSIAAADT